MMTRSLSPIPRGPEMTCFMTLGRLFPTHIFDLHTAYLAASNVLLEVSDEVRKRPGKRLSDACRVYGVQDWENIDKEQIAQDIGEGRWELHGKAAVLEYCEEDVRASAELLRRQIAGTNFLRAADVPRESKAEDFFSSGRFPLSRAPVGLSEAERSYRDIVAARSGRPLSRVRLPCV
jgi:hypothetical protein